MGVGLEVCKNLLHWLEPWQCICAMDTGTRGVEREICRYFAGKTQAKCIQTLYVQDWFV